MAAPRDRSAAGWAGLMARIDRISLFRRSRNSRSVGDPVALLIHRRFLIHHFSCRVPYAPKPSEKAHPIRGSGFSEARFNPLKQGLSKREPSRASLGCHGTFSRV